jgi:pyruvate dehydrogenase E2 component (dihydrolipoamide acetyltransferase)
VPPPPFSPAPRAPSAAAPAAPIAPAPEVYSPATLPPPAATLPFFLPDPDRVRATPRARLLAQERGIDLSEIAGSGPGGAVLVGDLERYVEALETQAEPLLHGDVAVTPVAQRIADELRIDLSRVKGTGPGGRITKRDLRAHLDREAREGKARTSELYGDELKLSQKRKFLIRNMIESKRSAPHFYLSMEVDAEPLGALRERLKAEGKRVTFTHMIVKACALALEGMPEVNATYREDRILRFNPINIGVAVDVQDELVAPVLKSCQGRDLEDLAQALDALIAKARERKLTPDDYSEGTFTVSNLGMFGVDRFYAILTPPQAMVLSVGALRSEPVVEGDRVRVGRRMSFGLGVDHRVLDGVKAAQFLGEVRRLIEEPARLLARSADHGA